jgi:hypothetical protein
MKRAGSPIQRPSYKEFRLVRNVHGMCDSVYYNIEESLGCPAADITGKVHAVGSGAAKAKLGNWFVANETSGHEMVLCEHCHPKVQALPQHRQGIQAYENGAFTNHAPFAAAAAAAASAAAAVAAAAAAEAGAAAAAQMPIAVHGGGLTEDRKKFVRSALT